MSVPLYRLLLQNSNLSPETQKVLIGLSDKLPVPGVDLLLGNDLCDGFVVEPIVSKVPGHSSSIPRYLKLIIKTVCLPAW